MARVSWWDRASSGKRIAWGVFAISAWAIVVAFHVPPQGLGWVYDLSAPFYFFLIGRQLRRAIQDRRREQALADQSVFRR